MPARSAFSRSPWRALAVIAMIGVLRAGPPDPPASSRRRISAAAPQPSLSGTRMSLRTGVGRHRAERGPACRATGSAGLLAAADLGGRPVAVHLGHLYVHQDGRVG